MLQNESNNPQAEIRLTPETAHEAAQVINSLATALYKEVPKKMEKLERALESIQDIISRKKFNTEAAAQIASICGYALQDCRLKQAVYLSTALSS